VGVLVIEEPTRGLDVVHVVPKSSPAEIRRRQRLHGTPEILMRAELRDY